MLITGCCGLIVLLAIPVVMILMQLARIEQRQLENCAFHNSQPISLAAEQYVCEHGLLLQSNQDMCSNDVVDLTRSDIVQLYRDFINMGEDSYDDVDSIFGEFEAYCSNRDSQNGVASYDCDYNFVEMSSQVRIFYSETDLVNDIRPLSCGT